MEFSWNPNPMCTEKRYFSISKHPFPDVPSFSKISKPTGKNQKIGKQCFLPPLSFKLASGIHPFINSLGFYLSRMLVEFSLICIFQHVWEKFFNLWCSHSWKIIESMLFYSCPSPPLKTLGRIFWKSVSHKTEGVGGSYNLLYQNSIRKYEDGLED